MSRIRLMAILAVVAALALPATASAASGGIKLHGQAGRGKPLDPNLTTKVIGNSTLAQASWTTKQALDGKFSMLLQKTAQTSDFAYAAAIVDGVEGSTVADLGNVGFSVNGNCGGGSPRFNLYYDNNGDGQADGVAFYGCGNHVTGSPATGWTSMSADASAPDFCYDFTTFTCTLTDASTVVQLSVLVDEQGTYYVDRVQAAGLTTGEPNGS